jgi:hypothetical protein
MAPFTGDFDGGGYTITVNITSGADWTTVWDWGATTGLPKLR